MNDTLIQGGIILIKGIVAVIIGVLQGNGAVYFFNKMPGRWLCDYDETPSEELLNPTTQRIKSHPWKYLFSMGFVILNIKLFVDDWQFALAATAALWLLLELALADKKYSIVPDQLVILLAVTAIGFIPFHGSWKPPLFGTLIGFGLMTAIALVGKFAYRRDTLGGGDIKIFSVIGLITGPYGILFVFAATTLISAACFAYLLAKKRAKITDSLPMVPYIAVATAAYLVFFALNQPVFNL